MDSAALGGISSAATVLEIDCPENNFGLNRKEILLIKEAVCRISGDCLEKWLDDMAL